MPKIWKILPQHSEDLKEQLLFNRGLKSKEEIAYFFNPSLENYSKELDIPGIKQALKRIEKAIKDQELIIVYGDYDVDGICASAILYKAFTSMGAKVLPYIPHREKEGYGLSKLGLEFARDSGASLVITVDNGIVALEQAMFAKELGLDLIITDHHEPLDTKPEAFAIVHSIKMCGAAVAWCLIKDQVTKDLSKELLQFVAIATICDMLPLVGIGRAFVKEGLKFLNKTKNIGLISLISECGIKGEVGSYEIGHIIGPRLNAIGRLEHAIDALRLLCTKDPAKARKLAKLLCDANITRQQLTIEAIEQAHLKVDKKKKIHVLYSAEWAPGIIGLVAGRIAEQYYRPTIAMSVGESFAKGSARSIDGINIVEVIRHCSDILVDVGGHKGAAGFSIANEKIEIFKERLEKLMDGYPDSTDPVLEIESEIPGNKITKNLVKELEDFEPFGFGNSRPIFATKGAKLSGIRTVGDGKHLKFKAEGIDAIGFGLGSMSDLLQDGQLVDLAYYLDINKFNGSEILQLVVKDLRIN